MRRIYILLLLVFVSNQIFAQTLTLSPNECFFSPKGTLKLYGVSKVSDSYNNNKHYERIGSWNVISDTIVWGLKNVKAGSLNVELFAGVSSNENNSKVSIFLGNQEQELTVHATSALTSFESQGNVNFTVTETSETVELKIKIKGQNTTSNFGEIQKLVVTGSAIEDASIWIRRWRPAAIHGKFISDNDVDSEISVHEMNIMTPELYSYQVMTTEFGYIGSVNSQDSAGLTGLNFSLWSYSKNDGEPPHYQMSHLVAVGGKNAYFGRYGHEGTGVKPRGNNPYSDTVVYNYTVALRKDPGETYNTYWCYYFDPFTRHWKLYGCGKKYNKNGTLNYLNNTGGFVEVVGPPNNSRTGHRTRAVEFWGWRKHKDGSWSTINKMNPAYNSATSLSYKEWRQNSAGNRFVFKMGGFKDSGANPGCITLNNPTALPYYLEGTYLDELYKMPADFSTLDPEIVSSTQVRLRFNIENIGTNPEIKLYYSTQFALTEGIDNDKEIDTYWQEEVNVDVSSIEDGILPVSLTGLSPNTKYYYRLRIKNDEGITWSYDTETFSTKPLSSVEIEKTGVMLYPNPSEDYLNLNLNGQVSGQAQIFNLNGQLVLSSQIEGNKVDIQLLKKGFYFLKIPSYTKLFKFEKN